MWEINKDWWKTEAYIRSHWEQIEATILDFSGPGMVILGSLYEKIFLNGGKLLENPDELMDRFNRMSEEDKLRAIQIFHCGFMVLYLRAAEKLKELTEEPPVV